MLWKPQLPTTITTAPLLPSLKFQWGKHCLVLGCWELRGHRVLAVQAGAPMGCWSWFGVYPVFPHPAASTSDRGPSDWQQHPPVGLYSSPTYIINDRRVSAFDLGMSQHGDIMAHSESREGARLSLRFPQVLSDCQQQGLAPSSSLFVFYAQH